MRNVFIVLGMFLMAVIGPACGGDDEVAQSDVQDLTELQVVEIEGNKSAAPEGMTIITRKADYVAFFGAEPPAGLSFNKSWVIHYSMGVQSSGGYAARILGVQRSGKGKNAHLIVTTEDERPGPRCAVTLSLTNPQVTVKIPKQSKSIVVDQNATETVRDCSEPNWCAAALCGPGTTCDESEDACVEQDFCPRVRCANGYTCDEDQDACVGRPCDPSDSASCPEGMVCDNNIVCITTPCPADYRCEPAPADPCHGIDWAGTCEGTVLSYCLDHELITVECSPSSCGWRDSQSYYDCL